MDLLGIDRDHEDEDEDLAVNVPFHHLQTDTCFAVSFHPDTGENEFEDELEEEYLDPTPEDSTELGEVPEEPKKGSITPYYVRNYLSGYFSY